jgi:hypothetical protein
MVVDVVSHRTNPGSKDCRRPLLRADNPFTLGLIAAPAATC